MQHKHPPIRVVITSLAAALFCGSAGSCWMQADQPTLPLSPLSPVSVIVPFTDEVESEFEPSVLHLGEPEVSRESESASESASEVGTAIVRSEFIYETAPFPSCHASTIAESRDGTLVAAWFGGTHEKHPDVGIWVSRWIGNGWTAPVEVANGVIDGTERTAAPKSSASGLKEAVDRYPTWNPVLFQPSPTATQPKPPLLLFYKMGPSPQTWWGMLIRSDDGGVSWGTPERLPDGILGPIKNKPIELKDGSILCPSSTETDEDESKWQVHFERTQDLGRTWTKTQSLNDGIAVQAIQPSLLRLADGKLLAIGRSRQDRIFECSSSDLGKTWSAVGLGSLPNNNSGIDALTMRDGRHAIIYNHVKGTPGQWGGKRTPLNLALSENGRDWSGALTLESEPGEYSYPAMIETKDGKLHITYTWQRKRIKHVVVDPVQLIGRPIVDGQWPGP